ncbi:DUF6232 family protein [Paractinoplanes rishiriensis]|uniref:Uncharacterized protein n=1 Tax=Paractinoplanes rishiriensis TaxID=1050105 RepID=A0A919JX78_9ACTN|nr:DUF6232 family protein [Actinoplanes rishiriensis]GIE95132.1 hypothetical protein Ari01nite_25970 [Actinoplanes rishiriensis]
MPVYYRGRLATITHEMIAVSRTERRIVRFDELTAVQLVELGSASDQYKHRVLGGTALFGLVVAGPALGGVSIILAVVVAVVLLGYAGACIRVRPRVRYQLNGLVDEEWTTLVETSNRVEFQQVGRGLRRALEHREDRARHV